MNAIWDIIAGWYGIGQFLFFLIVLTTLFVFLYRLMFFVTVLIRGWPPENVTDAMKILSSTTAIFDDDNDDK